MIKRYKAILSLLLVVLLSFAVVTVTGVLDINEVIDGALGNNAGLSDTLDEVFDTYTSAGLPLMKTDIENVFYTMDTKGNVSFYEISNNSVKKLDNTGSFDVSISCSGQTLPATIHYLEKDGKTLGYGLFTNAEHPEVYLYDYAFFKVTDQFDAYKSKSKRLLLVDVDKTRFYDDHKVYSESFYLYDDNKTANFLNEDQRIVDLNARLRTDYKMFVDNILHQDEKTVLFFSSRFYNDYDYSDKVDIFATGGSGENVDNNRYVTDIAVLDFWRQDNGVYYLANKEADPESGLPTGFTLMFYDGKESKEIRSFDGAFNVDYLRSGSFILNKNTGKITDILTGKEYTFDYEAFDTSFKPDLFKVSENGKYCVVRGRNNLDKPLLGLLNFETSEHYTYTENMFGYVASLQALNDGTIAVSLAAGESAETYYQLLCNISDGLSVGSADASDENADNNSEESTSATAAEPSTAEAAETVNVG